MSAGTPNDPVLTGPETRDGAKTGAGMTEEARIMAAFLDATVECLDDPHPRGWVTTFLRLPADMWDEVHDRLTPGQRAVLDREIKTIDKETRMTDSEAIDSRRLAGALSEWADPASTDANSAKAVTQARDELIATAASLATADGFDARELVRDIGAAADRLIAAARKQGQS